MAQDPERIILQLELKDLLFHMVKEKPADGPFMEFNNHYFIVRSGIPDFIETLAPYFDFAIWTGYSEATCDFLMEYLISSGMMVKYVRAQNLHQQDESSYKVQKRLKRLRYLGFIIEKILCIETDIPEEENYGNYYIVKSFNGQPDNELADSALKLLELKNTGDTTRLNL